MSKPEAFKVEAHGREVKLIGKSVQLDIKNGDEEGWFDLSLLKDEVTLKKTVTQEQNLLQERCKSEPQKIFKFEGTAENGEESVYTACSLTSKLEDESQSVLPWLHISKTEDEPSDKPAAAKPVIEKITSPVGTPEEDGTPPHQEKPVVDYVQQPTVFEVTSEGGAIPEDRKASIEVAVCLSVGPCKYPGGVTPVSPVLKLHLQENFELLKPIEVTLTHFIHGESPIRVMKATRDRVGQFVFKEIPDSMTQVTLTGADRRLATFYIQHFCYLVLYVRGRSKTALRYCVCPVVPPYKEIPLNEPFFLYFFVTFHDPTFIEALEKQCKKLLPSHRVELAKLVEFYTRDLGNLNLEDVEVEFERPKWSSNWKWSTSYPPSPSLSVQPSYNDTDLKFWAERLRYPPSYRLEVCGSGPRTYQDEVKFTFSPNCKSKPGKIRMEIPLPGHISDPDDNSPEYITYRKHYTQLISAIRTDVSSIADDLFSKDLLSEGVHDSIRSAVGVGDKINAEKVVDNVREHIKGNWKNFDKLIMIFKDHPVLSNVARALTNDYEKQKKEFISGLFTSNEEKLIGNIREVQHGVKNIGETLKSLGIHPNRPQIQFNSENDLLSFVKERVASNPDLISDICTSFKTAGIKAIKPLRDAARARYPHLFSSLLL